MLPAARSDAPRSDAGSNVKLIFDCPRCGRMLTASLLQAGIKGPCPQCGGFVTAPQPRLPAGFVAQGDALPAPADQPSDTCRRTIKGRISADSALDHRHNDQRETARSLWIVTAFILAFGAVVAAIWLMKQWVVR